MKNLIIIRHGKSSWELQVRDHDRVLKQRGIEDAHLIGSALNDMDLKPDAIWSSTAARALQTATLITEYINYDLSKLKLTRELYTFDSNDLKTIVRDCDDAISTLLIVSHNHGITDFVNELGTTRFDNVPTTGVVALEFMQDSWSQINDGITKFNLFPKDIR